LPTHITGSYVATTKSKIKIPLCCIIKIQEISYFLYLSSVAKQQQQRHVYDHARTRHTAHNDYDSHLVKKAISRNNTMFAANPIYDEATHFTNRSIANNDPIYDTVKPQPRQTNADNNEVDKNPAYVERKTLAVNSTYEGGASCITNSEEDDYENMYPQPRQTDRHNTKLVENSAYTGTQKLAVRPAHDEGTLFSNNNIAYEDSEYCIMNPQLRQSIA